MKAFFPSLLALSLALTLAAPTAHARGPRAGSAAQTITNFHAVSPGIYRGGNPMPELDDKTGLDALVSLGVSTVISLQGRDPDDSWRGWYTGMMQPGEDPASIAEEKRYLESKGVRFLNLPFKSHKPVDAEGHQAILAALRELAAATLEKPVYVHCEHGKDRTGLIIAIHRVQREGWTAEKAYAEWVKFGHGTIHWLFTGELDDYFYQSVGR